MSYDLALLTPDGDLPPAARPITGLDLVLQRVRLRLSTHRGDYTLDREAGQPYLEWAQDRRTDPEAVAVALAASVRRVPGVRQVLAVAGSRSLAGTLRVTMDLRLADTTEIVTLALQPRGTNGNLAPWIVTLL